MIRTRPWKKIKTVLIGLAAALAAVVLLLASVGFTPRQMLAPERFIDIGLVSNKFRMLALDPDVRQITTWWMILETIYQTIRIYGTQQDMAQLYPSTSSPERASLSVWMGVLFMKVEHAQIMWGKVMRFCTHCVLGLMLLAFRVDWRASVIGFALGYISLALAARGGINFLLWPVIGNTVCFLPALLAHAILSRAATGCGV